MLGERFLTVNFLVRKWQIEYTRHAHNGVSEESYNTAENIAKISRWVREAFPEGQVTWALSWEALFDPGPHWQQVRGTLADCHRRFGDRVTINPGGGFPNVYNTKEQVNRDLEDAFEAIERWLGKPPRNIVSWQLSAANIAHAARRFGVVATSGHCWSQHGVDNLSQEGSIMYPYYPSLLNALRPAQSAEDQINYRGTGISGSDPAEEMLWWMNKDYRLGILRSGGGCRVIDYVLYKDAPPEPEGPQSNWSLPAILSQKQEGRKRKIL